MTKEEKMLEALIALDTRLAEQLLEDLNDESKRNHNLYNAIGKYLERHKFKVNSIEVKEEVSSVMQNAVADYDKVVAFKRAQND